MTKILTPEERAETILKQPRYVSADMKGSIDTHRDAIAKAIKEAIELNDKKWVDLLKAHRPHCKGGKNLTEIKKKALTQI